jgi:hypothetical protein
MKFKIGDHILFKAFNSYKLVDYAYFKGTISSAPCRGHYIITPINHPNLHYPIARHGEELQIDKNHYLKTYLQKTA